MTLVASALVTAMVAGPARAAEPIEGTWLFEGGEVLVDATGPGTFKGTVTKETILHTCPRPVGERVWEIGGSGSHYAGTWVQRYFVGGTGNPCGTKPGGAATWDVDSSDPANVKLTYCSEFPGEGPVTPSSPCVTLTRILAPVPPPSRGDVVKSPSNKRCASRRKFTIHLIQPDGIAIESAKIFLQGKRVKVLDPQAFGGEGHAAVINLRGLPRGTYVVRIVVVTTSGVVLKDKRKYHTCAGSRKS